MVSHRNARRLRAVALAALIASTLAPGTASGQMSPAAAASRYSVGLSGGAFTTITHDIAPGTRSTPAVGLRADRVLGRLLVIDARAAYTRVPLVWFVLPDNPDHRSPDARLGLLDLALEVQWPLWRLRPYAGAGGGLVYDHEPGRTRIDHVTLVTTGLRVDLPRRLTVLSGVRYRNAGDRVRNWDWEVGVGRRF